MPHRPATPSTGLRRRGLYAPLTVLFAFVLTAANPGLVFAWNNLSFSSTEEDHMITLTNQARASNGLKALIEDGTLTQVARQRAKYIYDNEYPYHTQKDGKTAFTILQSLGYCYKVAGENLGYNNFADDQSTQAQFNWFMNSPGHRANILGSTYDHIGVGAWKGSNSSSAYYHVFVMVFAQKCGSSPTPTPHPTATPHATPHPTATPHATPHPTTNPTADATAAAEPTPEVTPEPSVDVTVAPDPRVYGGDGSAVWSPWLLEGTPWITPDPNGPLPIVTPAPAATPEPTLDAGGAGVADTGMAVVSPLPDLNLVDAIVDGVVSSYFGQ